MPYCSGPCGRNNVRMRVVDSRWFVLAAFGAAMLFNSYPIRADKDRSRVERAERVEGDECQEGRARSPSAPPGAENRVERAERVEWDEGWGMRDGEMRETQTPASPRNDMSAK